MRISTLIVAALMTAQSRSPGLQVTPVPLHPAVTQAVIVGRAFCGASTWLLTKSADLIRLGRESRTPTVRHVRELRPDDSFWGLACLEDGSLWTLASGHVLARMTADGRIVERVAMVMPQIEVFGARDRLVLLGLPIVPGRPLLNTSPRGSPAAVRPWLGVIGRAGFDNGPTLPMNLVRCGIGFASRIPCWFVDQSTVSISDGTVARELAMPWLAQRDVDQSAPIRDIALMTDGSMWVLAASAAASIDGRRVGRRLSRVAPSGAERESVSLAPAARLIVWADVTSCLLLTETGGLLRVAHQGGW
jgi:hypothetical protein